MTAYITVGATTTHGGEVMSGSPHSTNNGKPISRKGDKVVCKKCRKLTTILTGDPSFVVDGAPIARAGDVTSCGAKLIAVQQSFCESNFEVMGVEEAEEIKREAQRYFNEVMGDEAIHKRIVLIDNDIILKGCAYSITFTDGSSLSGISDDEGKTDTFPISKDISDINFEIQRGM